MAHINVDIVKNFKYPACDKKAVNSFFNRFKGKDKVTASDLLKEEFISIRDLYWVKMNGVDLVDADYKKACFELGMVILENLPHPIVDNFVEAYKHGDDLSAYVDIFYKMRSMFYGTALEHVVVVGETLASTDENEYNLDIFYSICKQQNEIKEENELQKQILMRHLNS